MSETPNTVDREGQLANCPILEGLTGYRKYYYKTGERLLQQQRERRGALKQTPEYKEQARIYNERYRGKSAAAARMLEYYHRNTERISELRKRSYHRATVEEKDRRRRQRRERRPQAKLELPEEQRRGGAGQSRSHAWA